MKNSKLVNRASDLKLGLLFPLLFSYPLILSAQTNDNCANAIELNISTSCDLSVFSNENATREDTTVAKDPSCGIFSGGDVWFTLVVPASGALRVETDNLAGATPHVMTFYSGICGSFTEELCIQLDRQRTVFRPDLAGETLYLRMFNYAKTRLDGSSFELCVFEPEIPENDNCVSAIEIPVGETCNLEAFTSRYATSEDNNVASTPSCGHYAGGDVWFKTTVPGSGKMIIGSHNIGSGTEPSFAVYSGVCGAMTEISCYQLSEQYIFQDPTYANQEVYLRMFNFDNEEGYSFNLCLHERECENVSYDAGTILVCEGDHFIFGSQTLTQPGTYEETFITPGGCDSIVSLMIQTNPIYQRTENIRLCKGEDYTFPDGTTQNNIAENVGYTSFLTSAHGCDSIIMTEIEIDSVDVSVEVDGMSLVAWAENATFQWIDCSNGNSIISGEINQLFTSAENGEYAVIVTQNGCSETSDCYEFLLTAIENTNSPEVVLYPNPSAGDLYIQMDKEYDFISIDIIDIRGLTLLTGKYHHRSSIQLDLGGLAPGTYFALTETKEAVTITRILKY
jgi:hypothetical protein